MPRWAGAIGAVCLCSPAFGQDVTKTITLFQTGRADHEIRLQGFGMVNPNNCGDIGTPTFNLEVPPLHGVVCSRTEEGQLNGPVDGGVRTRCYGKKSGGIALYYLPRHDYTGSDSVRYVVRSPNKLLTYRVNAGVTVAPNVPRSSDAVPADISAPAGDAPQSPGPVPECTALVS